MTDRGLDIRRATIADASILADHRVSMFRDMGNARPEIETPLRDAAFAHIREAMAIGEYVAWVAYAIREPHRIVGGAGVQIRRLFYPDPMQAGHVPLSDERVSS